jgi:hypothetical protein
MKTRNYQNWRRKLVTDDETIVRNEQLKREPPAEEIEAKRKLEDELYAMGFRPFGYEW